MQNFLMERKTFARNNFSKKHLNIYSPPSPYIFSITVSLGVRVHTRMEPVVLLAECESRFRDEGCSSYILTKDCEDMKTNIFLFKEIALMNCVQ